RRSGPCASFLLHCAAPETRRKGRVHMLPEFHPFREIAAKAPARHASILCRIYAPARCSDDLVETIEQVERSLPLIGEIERYRGTGPGERKNGGRGTLPERLENREKRAAAGTGNAFQDFAYRLGPGCRGNHALVLQEPIPSIDPVPTQDPVEGVEKRLVVAEALLPFPQLLPVVERVEGAQGHAVDQ